MKKPAQIHKAYLYLGKRDKRGAKLVAKVKTYAEVSTRITDVRSLNLPVALERQLEQIAHNERMNWELWIETVDSYDNLKKRLEKRGYTNVSINPVPMISQFETINENKLEKPKKTMLKRGK